MSPVSKPTVFSEQDWNLSAIKEVEDSEKGNNSPPSPSVVYRASKTLAEKGASGFLNILSFSLHLNGRCFMQSAAWDFYEQHKSQIKWDIAVINPPFVSFFKFTLQK